MKRIVVLKLDHEGRELLRYEGEVLRRDTQHVCLRAVFQHDDMAFGHITFSRGDVFTEWFYSDRWYNVFRIEDGAGGALKGWYCNITRPAQIGRDVVSAEDLALDLFVAPDGSSRLLDEDEFAELGLSPPDEMAARRAVAQLRAAVAQGTGPFGELRARGVVRRA